jgi:hypothetical protein
MTGGFAVPRSGPAPAEVKRLEAAAMIKAVPAFVAASPTIVSAVSYQALGDAIEVESLKPFVDYLLIAVLAVGCGQLNFLLLGSLFDTAEIGRTF